MPLRATSIVAAPVIALTFAATPAVAHGDSTDWTGPGADTIQCASTGWDSPDAATQDECDWN